MPSLKKSLLLIIPLFLIILIYFSNYLIKPKVLGIVDKKVQKSTQSTAKFSKDYLADAANLIVISETPVPTNTPTPTPTLIPTLPPLKSLDEIFDRVSHEQSVERDILKKIAVCESGLNPRAVNGDYVGLYQFSTNTWIATRRKMNKDPSPLLRFSPEDAVKAAAFKIATEGKNAWPNCKR